MPLTSADADTRGALAGTLSSDEWAEGRRYFGFDILARAQAINTNTREEGTTT